MNQLLENAGIADEYNAYLSQHIQNVKKGYAWLKSNLPEVVSEDNFIEDGAYFGELDEIIEQHDKSKYINIPSIEDYYELKIEFDPYAQYFYGTKKDEEVKLNFQRAWLSHIHQNPHHWQHWLLHNDTEGLAILDMPYVFIIEMICDHWSFSWKNNNLYEIFDWYEKHKEEIIFSDKTRKTYEDILQLIKEKLDEES